MRKLAMVALALMCVAGSASVATAQGGGGGGGMGGGRGGRSAIDRWMTNPDTVKVSADVQKKIDDLKTAYTADQQKIMADANGDRAAAAPKTAELNTKYQGLLKALLSTEQAAILDKNIAAAAARGRGRGGL
jgi:hypothetical protein